MSHLVSVSGPAMPRHELIIREWVSEQGPALGAGISGAIVASYHTCVLTIPYHGRS